MQRLCRDGHVTKTWMEEVVFGPFQSSRYDPLTSSGDPRIRQAVQKSGYLPAEQLKVYSETKLIGAPPARSPKWELLGNDYGRRRR
jgi:hypothetical protein